MSDDAVANLRAMESDIYKLQRELDRIEEQREDAIQSRITESVEEGIEEAMKEFKQEHEETLSDPRRLAKLVCEQLEAMMLFDRADFYRELDRLLPVNARA